MLIYFEQNGFIDNGNNLSNGFESYIVKILNYIEIC